MDAVNLLLTRESATKLEAPGPSEAELDRIFESAGRAPDHGKLRPWRFVVIPTDRREAFGELLAASIVNSPVAVTDPSRICAWVIATRGM